MTRDEAHASAFIDINTGLYSDSGSDEKSLSLFDFAVPFGGLANFTAAWEYFAARANVEIPKRRKKTEDINERLEFEPWTNGNETLVTYWGLKRKQGVSLEAIKLAGGRVARWPCYRDEADEKQLGKHKVIALPSYGPQLAAAQPTAWVIFNVTGQPLEVYRGKGQAPDQARMLSIGSTAGTLMGKHALDRLAGNRNSIEVVWKTAGVSDALALLTSIPPELRDSHLVLTNASGECGEVAAWNIELLAGLKVYVIHDLDKAGRVGALKWIQPLSVAASEVRDVLLPGEIAEKHGFDLREWLQGKEATP